MFSKFASLLLLAGLASAQSPVGPGPGGNANPGNQGFGFKAAPVPEFAALKPVPHGEVRIVWYDGKAVGLQRRMYIYTPPGYAHSGEKYPVLYLIHGRAQDDATWFDEGRVEFILDNLLAAGKATAMIVVMPNGGVLDPSLDRAQGDNTPEGLAARISYASKDRDAFLKDLVDDIIPYMDSNFRVLTNSQSRAIAGLSFGGAESLWAGTAHSDLFGWIGVFSMGIQGGSNVQPNAIAGSGSDLTPDGFVKAHPAFFADSKKTNDMVKLFWIGVGKDDHVVGSGPKQLSETLTAHDIRNTYQESEGGHTMVNWQVYLRDFASLLFH